MISVRRTGSLIGGEAGELTIQEVDSPQPHSGDRWLVQHLDCNLMPYLAQNHLANLVLSFFHREIELINAYWLTNQKLGEFVMYQQVTTTDKSII